MSTTKLENLEVWGGIEATINRVGDTFNSQLEKNGHLNRPEDLELFAKLGIKALRYPLLWEQLQPDPTKKVNWQWADERLEKLEKLGIRPIIGLLHHGSGPRHTSLIDPHFPEQLALFASQVARRYPWVKDYTPVNEPLTTARFSGLYGHWYPHGKSELEFSQCLLGECRATVLAMQAIREINPGARLVQTEDIGKTYATPPLKDQAQFDNIRRFLSLDLLTGKVNHKHRMWPHLKWAGIAEADIAWFLEHPCPPDLIGINYYLTSERFLDHRIERYPNLTVGGNGKQSYVDLEAVRIVAEGIVGPEQILREVWERYKRPIAITEAHLGCTREEQLRWLWEVWQAAQALRAEQIPIEAVTVWSLLGAYDWDSLLTRFKGHYETGVYDLRSGIPRPTALANLVSFLAENSDYSHPILENVGWWKRAERLLYPPVSLTELSQKKKLTPFFRKSAPILITGGRGSLGRAFARICESRGLEYYATSRQEIDITNITNLHSVLSTLRPWAVINAAGYVKVDQAEQEKEKCKLENSLGPHLIAQYCAEAKIPFLTFSSDLVFDGKKGDPYLETDPVGPLNVYGQSKAEMEKLVRETLPSALIIRTSAFFGPWDEYNFISEGLKAIASAEAYLAANDITVTPTYLPDLVNAALDLLIDQAQGLWHLSNGEALSWFEFMQKALKRAQIPSKYLIQVSHTNLGYKAIRPAYSALASSYGQLLPDLDQALDRYFQDKQVTWSTSQLVSAKQLIFNP